MDLSISSVGHFFDIRTSKSAPKRWCCLHFEMRFAPHRRAIFRNLSVQKWSEPIMFFNMLSCKCASRHNGVPFFYIPTSKSGPSMVCFVHFDLQMCFARQRRAIFLHPNCQKWSEPGVFCTPRFSEPTFRPSPISGKTQCFATFLTFRAPASPFF